VTGGVDGTEAVVDWLIAGAPSASEPKQILAQLCGRLLACGIPLLRAAVFVRTLHPQIMGRRILWRPDTGAEILEAPFEVLESEAYRNSPLLRIYSTGGSIRYRRGD
jgi:adenylate cyclase